MEWGLLFTIYSKKKFFNIQHFPSFFLCIFLLENSVSSCMLCESNLRLQTIRASLQLYSIKATTFSKSIEYEIFCKSEKRQP